MENVTEYNQHAYNSGPHIPQQKKYPKKKQPQHSGNIVFSKGNRIQTVPCLSKQVKGFTECTIGLQYVWEYRSPSKSVPPHYQCRLCSTSSLQHEIIDHIKGWKHMFRYLKKHHSDKVSWEEGDALRDPGIRKAIKVTAAEVEQNEGKGQIKVVLKEPCDVPAFKGLCSIIPKPGHPQGMRPMGPPFNPRFSGPFPPQGDPFFDSRMDEYNQSGFGEFCPRSDFPDSGMNQRSFQGDMGDHSAMGGRDGHMSGQLDQDSGKYLGNQMDEPINRSLERPGLMGAPPQNQSNTLMAYLDTFRIENEDDAQLVLKVTQKLTDVLMDYRLRNVSNGSIMNNMSMSTTNLSQTPSRFPGSTSRYSGSSGYSDGPSRFFS